MKRTFWTAAVLGGLLLGAVGVSVGTAFAADPIDPAGAYGAAQVAAASATCFPATGLNSRAGILVSNLGPNTIYCGNNSSVTTATGTPIASNASLSIGISYRKGSTAGQVQICCITTVLQVSPADTRYWEAR